MQINIDVGVTTNSAGALQYSFVQTTPTDPCVDPYTGDITLKKSESSVIGFRIPKSIDVGHVIYDVRFPKVNALQVHRAGAVGEHGAFHAPALDTDQLGVKVGADALGAQDDYQYALTMVGTAQNDPSKSIVVVIDPHIRNGGGSVIGTLVPHSALGWVVLVALLLASAVLGHIAR